MGKGVEGQREIVLPDARDRQSRVVSPARDCRFKRKSFSIFILRGRGDKGGWVTMAEKLHQMEGAIGRKANKQEVRVVGKSALERSYAKVVKRPSWRITNSIRVKVKREETLGNLQKLEHCLVGIDRWEGSSWGWSNGTLGLATGGGGRLFPVTLVEFRPVVRKKQMVCSEASGRESDEVRGDVVSHPGLRVEEELVSARLEILNLSAEVRGAQESGSGREMSVNRAQGPAIRDWASTDALVSGSTTSGPIVGPKDGRRAGGPVLLNRSLGSKLKEVATGDDGSKAGPSSRRWAVEMDCQKLIGLEGMERASPVMLITQALSKGPQEQACLLNCNISRRVNLLETKPFVAWETEDFRKQQMNVSYSTTNRALEEEALRYGSVFYSRGKRALGASHLNSFYFDRAPEGEFYDRSGVIEEEFRVENTTWLTVDEGSMRMTMATGTWEKLIESVIK
ncbi:hypothetical protein CK203_025178 [Vitis vinifera]|uniref:DUF4283 domain-containing protein n=1 Tax=Vitis vinifera TaxID=29760 RepID=A0A438JFA1_VITVI|nr:hypothetical protein CK203_025178 [Vitis vinifera]